MPSRLADLSKSVSKILTEVNKMNPIVQLSLVIATPVVAVTTLIHQHQEHKHDEKGWTHEDNITVKNIQEKNDQRGHETNILDKNIQENKDQRAHELIVLEKKKWWRL